MATSEQDLIEKLRRIEALYSRPGTDGERDAAARARDRILARLRDVAPSGQGAHERDNAAARGGAGGAAKGEAAADPAVEYRFSMADPWSQRLLYALLRHHGIATYRRRGQRRTSITARVSRRFVDEVVWPEFCEFERELRDYFDKCTDRIIEQALEASVPRAGATGKR